MRRFAPPFADLKPFLLCGEGLCCNPFHYYDDVRPFVGHRFLWTDWNTQNNSQPIPKWYCKRKHISLLVRDDPKAKSTLLQSVSHQSSSHMRWAIAFWPWPWPPTHRLHVLYFWGTDEYAFTFVFDELRFPLFLLFLLVLSIEEPSFPVSLGKGQYSLVSSIPACQKESILCVRVCFSSPKLANLNRLNFSLTDCSFKKKKVIIIIIIIISYSQAKPWWCRAETWFQRNHCMKQQIPTPSISEVVKL